MRTLILGGTGMLGRAVLTEARGRGWPALAPSHDQIDISNPNRLAAAMTAFRPELIVNCAAFTKVDDCEAQRNQALAVNGDAVARIVEAADAIGARVVQVSSDYVFNGRAETPYREDAAPDPLSVYGESKLLGEKRALESTRSLVLRASWLFGPGGANFMTTMLRLFERQRTQGTPVRVVADQVGCPTYTPFLAEAICVLAERGATGMMHYRNRGAVSWHEFATTIAAAAGSASEVAAITTAEFPRPAARPAYSVLNVQRFETLVGRRVESWSAGVELYMDLIRKRMN